MEKTYAKALFELSSKPGADSKKLVETLIAHLRETGRLKLLPRILRELKRLDARASTLSETLEVASESEKASATKEAKELGITAHATVNSDLVSGWRAQTGSRIIDRSGKRALLDLYKRITVQH
jgi:F0F1-type ATP synthase delta subunit